MVDTFYSNSLFCKTGFFPQCERLDSQNIKCCKFGGSFPVLRGSEAPVCEICGNQLELLLQVYVPALPDTILSLFPESKRENLYTIFYCTDCMESNQNLVSFEYTPDDFDELVFVRPKADSKVESSEFSMFEELLTYDDTSNSFHEAFSSCNMDGYEFETHMRQLRDSMPNGAKTFLGGMPRYEQGEQIPEGECVLLANIEDDCSFSMMWGDAGSAQLWMKLIDEQPKFILIWESG